MSKQDPGGDGGVGVGGVGVGGGGVGVGGGGVGGLGPPPGVVHLAFAEEATTWSSMPHSFTPLGSQQGSEFKFQSEDAAQKNSIVFRTLDLSQV